ncbi:hypothetical protein J1N35_028795 [Gossypium stocksii]|uniref:Uncharacterized protein n=1 Tax=Gossypium stocksii TaxID=47602 RepID=A0A9D3UWZ9_9ROSI|nr:hypothetical protein J1N35_028795 [Gossypium stocksii]
MTISNLIIIVPFNPTHNNTYQKTQEKANPYDHTVYGQRLGRIEGEMQSMRADKKQVCINTWIYHNMKRCINGQKVGVFFPHLVTALCKEVRISMTVTEQFIKQPKSIIRDSMYTQYIEIQRKQIWNLNKRRKEKMDIPTLLKQKTTSTSRRES